MDRTTAPRRPRPHGWADEQAAAALAYARLRRRPMKTFAFQLRRQLGWAYLSRQTIYEWEQQRTRIPAAVLLAAARVVELTVDELIAKGRMLWLVSTPTAADVSAKDLQTPDTVRARQNNVYALDL